MNTPPNSSVRPLARPRVVPLAILLSLSTAPIAQAASPAPTELEFSDGFLIGGSAIDMARYASGNPLAAGVHGVDLWINGEFVGSRDVTFHAVDGSEIATPCVPATLLDTLSLKPDYRSVLQAQSGACLDLPAQIEGATVSFDSSTLQLNISVPQAA
ncbi:FimD/PapC N-terminal domain-containing protein [Stenotrophomonas indicatrix]